MPPVPPQPRKPRLHTTRSLLLSLILVLLTIAVGLAIRFAPLGLTAGIVKYGGSALWALTIYWLVSAFFPFRRIPTAALLAASIATAVEFFKLYRSPWLDAFRHTLLGILLLGRIFSGWDILAYGLAIAVGALMDRSLRRSNSPAKLDKIAL
jgi:hypothetical protein